MLVSAQCFLILQLQPSHSITWKRGWARFSERHGSDLFKPRDVGSKPSQVHCWFGLKWKREKRNKRRKKSAVEKNRRNQAKVGRRRKNNLTALLFPWLLWFGGLFDTSIPLGLGVCVTCVAYLLDWLADFSVPPCGFPDYFFVNLIKDLFSLDKILYKLSN